MLLLLHQIFFGRHYLGEAVLHCFGELKFSNIFVKDGLHFYLADIFIVSFFIYTGSGIHLRTSLHFSNEERPWECVTSLS